VRQLIISAVPKSLFAAVGGGIGLFIAFIGLRDAGIIVAKPGTIVTGVAWMLGLAHFVPGAYRSAALHCRCWKSSSSSCSSTCSTT
jgi:xanthine/uracil/vitamin C permease (AzgA family)